jgi:2-polyprenyl-3-methyl-5-hydroxy-6-metoxy-1,4-benzoquinol methylase
MKRSTQVCRVCGLRRPSDDAAVPCDSCGFVFLGPGSTTYDYEGEYDEKSSYNSQPTEVVLDHYRRAPNTGWALEQLKRLKREEGCASLFEFGASQGAFMALARAEGYHVKGVELSSASIRYAHERLSLRSELEQGVWRARRADEPMVDVVCAFEVLEHSDDPIEFLRMMRSWVRPRGCLMISVPNGRRLSVRLGKREPQDLPPHHLMYWTSSALVAAATRMSIETIEVKTSALTHSDLLNLAAPQVAAQRAVETGSCRPVGAPEARRGLGGLVKTIYPVATKAGALVAGALNRVPELGQRLMFLGRA